ncbi:MAG: DUF1761 domain-containing protein [Bacteroidetes bacterium]|nr:DUF1761 domain-containing protein [Bacteroidota bacterium]
MNINFLLILITALVPLVVGTIWYNPKVFGRAWMQAAEMTEEKMKNPPMVKIFLLSFLFAFLLAFSMQFMVIHQYHLYSLVADTVKPGDTTSVDALWLNSSLESYGKLFRTFKHGAFHGLLTGIFMVLPIIGTHALYEKKTAKYIFINAGYWMVSMMIMGGILCQWA